MLLPASATGFGLNQISQNVLANGMSRSNMFSLYNNGFTRLGFKVFSQIPNEYATTNYQAREFNNMNFVPVLQHVGQNGLISLPAAFNHVNPDNIPTMSQLTNWGGNSGAGIDPYTGAPVYAMPSGPPQGYPPPQVPGYAPPPQVPPAYGAPPQGYPPPQVPGYAPPPQAPPAYGAPLQGYPPPAYAAPPPVYSYPPPQRYAPPPVYAPYYFAPPPQVLMPQGFTPIPTQPGQPAMFMAPPVILGPPPPMMVAPPVITAPPIVLGAPPIYLR